jgi:hypothetical protein
MMRRGNRSECVDINGLIGISITPPVSREKGRSPNRLFVMNLDPSGIACHPEVTMGMAASGNLVSNELGNLEIRCLWGAQIIR